jgi:hypothetical protein
MKTSIQINLPIEKAFELFMDKNNFKNWKKEFVSFEQISGSSDEIGSVTKLVYTKFTMFETIVSKNSPSEYVATYEYKRGAKTQMFHKAVNTFTLLDANKTSIVVNSEIIKVNGIFLNLMMKLMAGAGRKYSQEQLDKFKVFAESRSGKD